MLLVIKTCQIFDMLPAFSVRFLAQGRSLETSQIIALFRWFLFLFPSLLQTSIDDKSSEVTNCYLNGPGRYCRTPCDGIPEMLCVWCPLYSALRPTLGNRLVVETSFFLFNPVGHNRIPIDSTTKQSSACNFKESTSSKFLFYFSFLLKYFISNHALIRGRKGLAMYLQKILRAQSLCDHARHK